MSWKLVGGDGRLGIYAWVPDPPDREPPAAAPTPPPEPFFRDDAKIECEFGLVYPCLERQPVKARWMLQWQECNCQEGLIAPAAICVHCFSILMTSLDAGPHTTCSGCDLHFVPARAMIADLVELP